MPKNQHVVPLGSEWAVRGEGNGRATSIHRTQAEAIEVARKICINQRSELIIHRSDGRIRDRDSYGGEPLPPKSPRKVLFPPTSDVSDPHKIRTAVKEVLTEHRDKVSPSPHSDRRH